MYVCMYVCMHKLLEKNLFWQKFNIMTFLSPLLNAKMSSVCQVVAFPRNCRGAFPGQEMGWNSSLPYSLLPLRSNFSP